MVRRLWLQSRLYDKFWGCTNFLRKLAQLSKRIAEVRLETDLKHTCWRQNCQPFLLGSRIHPCAYRKLYPWLNRAEKDLILRVHMLAITNLWPRYKPSFLRAQKKTWIYLQVLIAGASYGDLKMQYTSILTLAHTKWLSVLSVSRRVAFPQVFILQRLSSCRPSK